MEWAPPSIMFPPDVKNYAEHFDGVAGAILKSPPLLSEEALRHSLGEGLEPLGATVAEGQKAVAAGKLSFAIAILEPAAANHPQATALSGLVCYALGLREKAVLLWETLAYMMPDDGTPNLYMSLVRLGRWMTSQNPKLHPETDAMAQLCNGRGIDVGCGANKTCPEAIGVASSDYMPMFATGSLDYVISRHNIEHYKDHVKALLEWARVLKPGGLLGVVAHDRTWQDTIKLDPTHYHVFTAESLGRLLSLAPALELSFAGGMVPRWSVMAVAQKNGGTKAYDYATEAIARDVRRIKARMDSYERSGDKWLAAECKSEIARLGGAGVGR